MKTGVRSRKSEDRSKKLESRSKNNLASCLLPLASYCRLLITISFLLSYAGDASAASSKNGENIRIAALKGIKELIIDGATAAEADGSYLLLQPSVFNSIIVKLDESGALTINGGKITGAKTAFLSDNDMLYINGRKYRGRIEVIKDQRYLLVVNELPLESYLTGLINHEISSKWPIEAVKAQAVIARTYAVYQKKKRDKGAYHMESTVEDQVYAGSMAEDDRSFYAVQETTGEILTYNGEPALTVYHSNGGGITEDSKNIWGGDYPYLRQVKSLFDKGSPNFSWVLNIDRQAVESALKDAGYVISDIKDITPLRTTNSGRVTRVRVRNEKGDLDITGEELRKVIGYDKLKSAMFTVEMINGSFVFNGRGSGHGVGLSQWGAKGMAENGYSYTEILEHFYPGTRIERIY